MCRICQPVRDKTGDVFQHFASFVDLTKHKQEEQRLQSLLDELNHRTQNTLATVQAIAAQTLRSPADKEIVDAFEGRILALSKAHEKKSEGEDKDRRFSERFYGRFERRMRTSTKER